jgi:cell division transport system ATP-binding protein
VPEGQLIEFEEACFSYGGKAVLRDVTLTLPPGSFHFLVGPSGSGKSTLLRLCYLDLAPTSGEVRIFGRRLAPRDRNAVADLRRSIGVVHQDCRFLDHLPLVENIALPLRVGGLDVPARAEDLRALLEWVDLTDRAEVMPRELSSGERQRAALARAVILSPEIILADEPTGAVDPDTALRLLTLLVELNRMGKTVLVATHDLNLIRAAKARVPVRVLRLAQGAVQTAEADR